MEVRTGTPLVAVHSVEGGLELEGPVESWGTRHLLSCAGLYADRVARLCGARPRAKVIPFRGEYYRIRPARLVHALVYPVPDPRFPFLGVHLTRGVDGDLHAGPNAVLALSREGYRRQDISVCDSFEVLTNPAFWKLARRHWRSGRDEMMRSLIASEFLAEARRLLPALKGSHLERAGAGVRAQLLDSSGALVDDFCFEESPHALHVLNAPSPAATAALAIAEEIVDRVEAAGWF